MTVSIPTASASVSKIEMTTKFEAVKARSVEQRQWTAKQRIQKLDQLYAEVLRRRKDIQEAMWADFQKPAEEVDLTELYVLKAELKAIRKGLRGWMREKPVPGGIAMLGAKSWIRPEAKGVAGSPLPPPELS